MRQWLPLLLSTAVAVYLVATHFKLPEAVPADASATTFSGHRAMHHVTVLASDIGIRLVGNPNNEEKALNYIRGEVERLVPTAIQNGWQVDVQVQRASGAVAFEFLYSWFTNAYEDVANVLVRLSKPSSRARARNAAQGQSPAVLISAHFDSTLGTPGASDDAAGIGVMLEVYSMMVHDPALELERDVVFNFNGAEESFLQAAHGFITGHPWAKDVVAFVNLEAVGADGPAIVFQAGPRNAWLADVIGESMPHPHMTVIAQDIFQNRLVPGDTDYRIYRDYGAGAAGEEGPVEAKLPGVDMAFYRNGHVYHTALDMPEATSAGALQHMGDNAAGMLKALARLEALPPAGEDVSETAIFLDLWGRSTLVLRHRTATVLYLALLVALVARVMVMPRSLLWPVLLAAGLSVVAIVLPLVATAGYGALMSALLGTCMPWYARHGLALLMYAPVATLAFLAVGRAGDAAMRAARVPPTEREHAVRLGLALLMGCLLALCMAADLGTAYLFALLMGCLLAADWAAPVVAPKPAQWQLRMALAWSLPLWHWAPLCSSLMELVAATLGKAGAVPSPIAETVMGGAVALMTVLALLPALQHAPRPPMQLASGFLCGLTVFAAVLGAFTFPYTHSHPKRLMLHHLHTFQPRELAAVGDASQAPLVSSSILASAFDPYPQHVVVDEVQAAGLRASPPQRLHHVHHLESHDPWQVYVPFSNFLFGFRFEGVDPAPRLVRQPPVVALQDAHRAGGSDGSTTGFNLTFHVLTHQPAWSTLNVSGADVTSWSLTAAPPRLTCPPDGSAPCTYVARYTTAASRDFTVWMVVNALPVDVTFCSLFVDGASDVILDVAEHMPEWFTTAAHYGSLQTVTVGKGSVGL